MTCYGKLNGESMIDLFKNGMALVKISVIISIAFMVNKLIFFGSVHYEASTIFTVKIFSIGLPIQTFYPKVHGLD